nr:transcription termination factor MTERF2, chloroplastic [Tanacetum cinerariifolium]
TERGFRPMTAAIADMQPLALFQAPRYWIVDSRHLLLLSPTSPAHLVCTNPNRPAVHYRSPRRLLSCCYSSSNPLAPPSGSAGDDGDHEDETHYKQKAIEAVSDILQKNGICEEESMEIAMKSPNYVQMLMDSVADLDQLYRSTSSISSMEYKDNIVDYKKKIFDMGIQKGDKGLVPVLESVVGLPLPSAIHIARYISSSAPHTSTAKILHKVKYVKEILFSDVDGKAPIGTSARRMMMHLSLSVDEDLQHTLSFLEKIQARRGGLDMLG